MRVYPARTTGILRMRSEYSPEKHAEALKSVLSKLDDNHPIKKGIETRNIPVG